MARFKNILQFAHIETLNTTYCNTSNYDTTTRTSAVITIPLQIHGLTNLLLNFNYFSSLSRSVIMWFVVFTLFRC